MNKTSKLQKKILLVGGHSTPAFAVLDELKSRGFGDFIWVGEKFNQRGNKESSQEYKIVVEKYKIKFVNLISGKLLREFSLGALIELFKIPFGFLQSFVLLLKYRPTVIVSFGGFLAVPIVIIGKILGIKSITHEQTIATGLATRIISRFADKILVSWEDSLKLFPQSKTVLTGNPLRKDIFKVNNFYKNKLNLDLKTLFITGGNQGAHEINKRIFPILEELIKNYNVIHQSGNSTITNDFKKSQDFVKTLNYKNQGTYIAADYFGSDKIGEIFSLSDLIISRGGANTTLEFMALGKAALIIPIPWINYGEQVKNAEYLEKLGLGKKLDQNNSLTPEKLYEEIGLAFSRLKDGISPTGVDLKTSAKLAKEKVNLDAAKIIGDIVQDL